MYVNGTEYYYLPIKIVESLSQINGIRPIVKFVNEITPI